MYRIPPIEVFHPFAVPAYTVRHTPTYPWRARCLLTHRLIPVAASRDLSQHPTLIIRRGTPGEITSAAGTCPTYYTVTFWPFGLNGAKVTIPNLSRTDVREA